MKALWELTADEKAQWASDTVAKIRSHLASGGKVQLTTYTRSVVYDRRHVDMFRASGRSIMVQRGKGWEDASGCGIRFSVAA